MGGLVKVENKQNFGFLWNTAGLIPTGYVDVDLTLLTSRK